MGIGSMIEREDFYKILHDTLLLYFLKVRNKKIECKYEPFENGEELRIYTLGSIVCRPNKPKGARTFFKAEYNIRNSIWKFIVGKFLVHFLMCTKTAFSPRGVFITKGVLGKNEFISPQNRSVRVYDYDKSHVDCIIKEGFTDKYFNNQIAFRKKYKYDFMVPMIDSGDGWFREPILVGHPLARVTGKRRYNEGINTTIDNIRLLAKDTLEYVQLKDYIPNLIAKARQLTELAKQNKNITTYDKSIELLDFIENELVNITMEIPTCISHGDLQTGNIWMNKDGKILIYDWETSGRRSVWYDSTTLLYSLRRVQGWEQFVNDETPMLSLACDPIRTRGKKEFDCIKAVVLLEDYMFLIEDMMELPQVWGANDFDENINRIYNVIKRQGK